MGQKLRFELYTNRDQPQIERRKNRGCCSPQAPHKASFFNSTRDDAKKHCHGSFKETSAHPDKSGRMTQSTQLTNPSQKAPLLQGRHASHSFPSPGHKNKTDSLVTAAFRRHVDEKEPNAKPGGTRKARTTPTTRVATVCDPANPFPIRDPTARDSHSPTINNRLCTNLQQTDTVLPLRGRTVTNNGTTAEPPRHFTRSEHRALQTSSHPTYF